MLALVLALVPTACGSDASDSAPPPVEQIARQLEGAGAASVIVFFSDDDREYTATAGSRPPAADRRFRIGSVTKTFTATIVLQLVAEGRLRLSDTLGRHVTGLPPSAERVTVRQLLSHSSGLANVTEYLDWLEQASRSASTRPIDVLRYAASKPTVFPPGSRWGYSNTNYIALGLVIESVSGRSYRAELVERLLEPLGLESTELPETRRLPDLNDAGENPNVPWAAGALVSNAHDLARFFSALMSGRVLSEDSLSLMKKTIVIDPGVPGGGGLGIFATELPCGRFWGHDGGILDYGTLVRVSADGDRVAVVSVHGGGLAGPPPDEKKLLCHSRATKASPDEP